MRWNIALPLLFPLWACATVPPGSAGVVLTAHGVLPEPLPEGLSVIPPLARVDLFDLRAQNHDENLTALTADGAPVLARASVVTYHIAPADLVALDREVGPAYYEVLIRPIVRAAALAVLSRYRADALDTSHINLMQQQISQIAKAALLPRHIMLDGVLLRGVTVPAELTYQQVLQTGQLEQLVLQIPQELQLARQRADGLRETARGLRKAHAVVAPTLTPPVLTDQEQRAWTRLLTAPATTVQVNTIDNSSIVEVTP